LSRIDWTFLGILEENFACQKEIFLLNILKAFLFKKNFRTLKKNAFSLKCYSYEKKFELICEIGTKKKFIYDRSRKKIKSEVGRFSFLQR